MPQPQPLEMASGSVSMAGATVPGTRAAEAWLSGDSLLVREALPGGLARRAERLADPGPRDPAPAQLPHGSLDGPVYARVEAADPDEDVDQLLVRLVREIVARAQRPVDRQDLVAQLDALAADVDPGPRDQLLDLVLPFAAERAAEPEVRAGGLGHTNR